MDSLKQELAALEAKDSAAKKQYDDVHQAVFNNPEMKALVAKTTEVTEEVEVIGKRLYEMQKNVRLKFTTNGDRPEFQHRTSDFPQRTNITSTTLFYIDCAVPLRLLRKDDIQDAVKRLIAIEEEKNPEISQLNTQHLALDKDRQELWRQERELDHRLRSAYHVDDLASAEHRRMDELRKIIKNPKLAVQRVKSEDKREEARASLQRDVIIQSIYTKITTQLEQEAKKKQ